MQNDAAKKSRLRHVTINGGVFGNSVTGVQRYAIEITKKMINRNPDREESIAIAVRGDTVPHFKVPAGSLISTISLPRPVWAQIVLPFYCRGTLVSLGNIGPLAIVNQILCVHDVNVVLARDSYSSSFRAYYNFLVPKLARRVRRLTTVSEFSRRSLKESGFSTREDIVVIPNGHEHVLNWDPAKATIILPEHNRPYVFMLGSRARHKNTRIVEMIAKKLDDIGLDLVIAGRSGGNFTNVEIFEQSNIFNYTEASDNDLARLYRNALCLAFPSLTEGFGLPALEAMALDCPVVCSTTGSLPEVCGSAALYADPNREEEWFDQIRRLRDSEALRSDCIGKGRERLPHFTWQAGAQHYAELTN